MNERQGIGKKMIECHECDDPHHIEPCIMIISDDWDLPEHCPYFEGRFAEWRESVAEICEGCPTPLDADCPNCPRYAEREPWGVE